MTRRQGRPYTLVLKKADALFALEQEARDREHADLQWLAESARTLKFDQSGLKDR